LNGDIEVRVADNKWLISQVIAGGYLIQVNEKALAFYHPAYPEAFLAAWKRLLREVNEELGMILN